MEASFWFVAWALMTGFHLYYMFNALPRIAVWLPVGIGAAFLLVAIGAYPPIFERGEGYWTPNRALGLVAYLGIFAICTFAGALKHWQQVARYYRDLTKEGT